MRANAWIRKTSEHKWATRLGIVATLGVGILLGTLVSNGVLAQRDNHSPTGVTRLSVPSPVQLSSVFSQVAEKVEPAVVRIRVESFGSHERARRRSVPEPFNDFFDRFFDVPPEQFRQSSQGSGVIVDAAGYILTNHHVVDEADRIKVRLAGDNKEIDATIVGVDEDTDLAVIKVDVGRPLPYAPMGNSDAAQVGDWVLAIGSPFDLDATVTAGIISYKGRPSPTPGQQFQQFIQTDAAINRGNSGGPLVNLAGEVIGINTAIMSRNGLSAGVGFALPSGIAVEVYNQIIEHGRVVRGSIGIQFNNADSTNEVILRNYGADHGVIIEEVKPNSPAAKAGLQVHDVITEINGEPIKSGNDLIEKVTSTPVGEKVEISYLRDGKKEQTATAVEEFRKIHADRYGEVEPTPAMKPVQAELGLTLEELTPAMARRVRLEDDGGLVVTRVEAGSFADDIGFVRNDVILEVNRRRVRTIEDFEEVQRSLTSGEDVVFWVKRRALQGWVGLHLYGALPQ